MPKMKTNRATAKRIWKTGGKAIRRGKAFRRHLLTGKPRARKRQLRRSAAIHSTNIHSIERLLPN